MHYLCKTEDTAAMGSITSFFREVEKSVEMLEEKYSGSNLDTRYRDLQVLVGTRSMVVRCLKKMHDKVIRRFHQKPSLALPWMGNFTLDVPREIFEIISKNIIQRNTFGHKYHETKCCIIIEFTDRRKAVFVFDKLNFDGVLIPKKKLLVKFFNAEKDGSLERCEVVISSTKPMKMKFYKSTETLSVHFHYGYWNKFGVAQH